MNDSSKTYWTDDPELVEKYVLGKISDEERKRFDAEIADCVPCKEKLRHEMKIAAGIRRYGRDAVKSRLKAKLRREQSSQIFRYQWIGLAAAVAVIAVGIGVYQIWFSELAAPKKFGNREIVLKYTEAPQESSNEKNTQSDTEKQKAEGSAREEESRRVGREPRTGRAQPNISTAESSPKKDLTAPAEGGTQAGAVSSQQQLADEAKITTADQPARSIWLIGAVVMVTDGEPQPASKISPRAFQSEQYLGKEEQKDIRQRRTVTIQRDDAKAQIVLRQRSFRELPASRQTQMNKERRVETLIEESSAGLHLTIFSDIITADELQRASVEIPTDDSLVIAMPSQRISYRLPVGWNLQQRMHRR